MLIIIFIIEISNNEEEKIIVIYIYTKDFAKQRYNTPYAYNVI